MGDFSFYSFTTLPEIDYHILQGYGCSVKSGKPRVKKAAQFEFYKSHGTGFPL